MKPFLPATICFVLAFLVVFIWPKNESSSFSGAVMRSLRAPTLTILLICGVVYLLAAGANLGVAMWLGMSEGPTLNEILSLQSDIDDFVSNVNGWNPGPLVLAAITFAFFIFSFFTKAGKFASSSIKSISMGSAWIGIILASVSTLTLLPGSLPAASSTLSFEVARTKDAMSIIQKESQSLSSSLVSNDLFNHVISHYRNDELLSLNHALSRYQSEIRKLRELSQRNHRSSGRLSSDLSARVADDWRDFSNRRTNYLLRAQSQLVGPLPPDVIKKIERSSITRIKSAAQKIQSAPIIINNQESVHLTQIRQSFINNSARAIVDKLGVSTLRAAISGNPIALQFLEALTDALIEEANTKYLEKRSRIVFQALQNYTNFSESTKFNSSIVNQSGSMQQLLKRVYDAEDSLSKTGICTCKHARGTVIWTMNNVTLEQCYSRIC